jgi:predicted RNA-binding Zn-ribbon protein involved in translation (DUF1610 family)
MKKSELLSYLHNTKESDIDIDFSSTIVQDEFNNRRKGNYREDSINRLIESGQEWHTEGNIDYEVTKKFVKVFCPYCDNEMILKNSYHCEKCGAEVILSITQITVIPNR